MCSKQKIAIQDTYGQRFQHCWGCGPKNEEGLHLKSFPSEDGSESICRFTPEKQYTGGVPANLYGGMIAMIFDCHGTASAAWFNHHNNGLTLNESTVITRYITGRLEIDFLSPVPMEKEIIVTAKAEEIGERKVIVSMQMETDGKIHAKAKMIAVRVKDNM
ncbi:MAG: hotdog domain-containing protein [Tissierellia bacterium]|nr:hotdog domain-containing protein [Tissierellia bacterium]